jgi:hypothetical protein
MAFGEVGIIMYVFSIRTPHVFFPDETLFPANA